MARDLEVEIPLDIDASALLLLNQGECYEIQGVASFYPDVTQ